MFALFLVALLGLLAVFGFWVGTVLRQRDGSSKTDRREMQRLRDFEAEALGLAHEHLAYGDPLATKIINIGRKELQ